MIDPSLAESDSEIHELVRAEERRQADTMRLIPSENYASKAVMEASGSCLNNKYSEGYPLKRYYQGQAHIDAIEELAKARLGSLSSASTTSTFSPTPDHRRTWPSTSHS